MALFHSPSEMAKFKRLKRAHPDMKKDDVWRLVRNSMAIERENCFRDMKKKGYDDSKAIRACKNREWKKAY